MHRAIVELLQALLHADLVQHVHLLQSFEVGLRQEAIGEACIPSADQVDLLERNVLERRRFGCADENNPELRSDSVEFDRYHERHSFVHAVIAE